MRYKAIDNEDYECHHHEHSAQQKQLQQWLLGAWLDKLRQESQKEDGQLWVKDVQQKGRHQIVTLTLGFASSRRRILQCFLFETISQICHILL